MIGWPKRQEDISFANDLNHFQGRFDAPDSKDKSDSICTNIPRNPTIQLSEEEVGTCPTVLTKLFQFLKLYTYTMPTTWKASTIRPVSKKSGSKELNNFCPIALTSVLAKRMERVGCNRLTSPHPQHNWTHYSLQRDCGRHTLHG